MTFSRKHFVGSILIVLFGGASDVLLLCADCRSHPFLFSSYFFARYAHSGFSWLFLWAGSEFLVDQLDRVIPWVVNPLRRLAISLASIAVLVFIVVWGLDIFFDTTFYGKSFTEALASLGAPYFNVFLVTLTINVFMHGRGFLLAWRQASIDNERLKTQQIITRYETLKNQVNPHFLFNSLNALSSLVYDDQAKAVVFIRKLAEVYRYVLDKREQELVPIHEELTFAKNYIFLQKIRFGANLKIDVIGETVQGFLPPLALQLLVENAIKHNVVSEQYPLTIKIHFEDNFCKVENTLREKLDKDSTGVGLDNLKDRYQYLTNEKVIVEKDKDKFQVSLPILNLTE